MRSRLGIPLFIVYNFPLTYPWIRREKKEREHKKMDLKIKALAHSLSGCHYFPVFFLHPSKCETNASGNCNWIKIVTQWKKSKTFDINKKWATWILILQLLVSSCKLGKTNFLSLMTLNDGNELSSFISLFYFSPLLLLFLSFVVQISMLTMMIMIVEKVVNEFR